MGGWGAAHHLVVRNAAALVDALEVRLLAPRVDFLLQQPVGWWLVIGGRGTRNRTAHSGWVGGWVGEWAVKRVSALHRKTGTRARLPATASVPMQAAKRRTMVVSIYGAAPRADRTATCTLVWRSAA